MSTKVVLKRCAEYDAAKIKEAIAYLIDSLGGASAFVKPGDSVLLKPNLLAGFAPEKAVTTHPSVVRAVAELVIDAGGKPFIADSPAIPGFKRIAKSTGMEQVAADLGIECFGLRDSTEVKQGGKKIFRMLEISKHVLEADRIINLPKFKTHTQMYLTLGVKNIFGCVVGARKSQWHLKAGVDRIFFARMLMELYQAVAPTLTIIDGVIGMEGDGPGGSGIPRPLNLLAASEDAVALDRVMVEVVGARPDALFTHQVALENGVGEPDLGRIDLAGDELDGFRVTGFRFPKITGLMPIPGPLKKFMTNQLTSKPREDLDTCTLCKMCVDICPTDVISRKGDRLAFDYDKCIRCFCCVEVCPEGSMKPRVPFLLRLIG